MKEYNVGDMVWWATYGRNSIKEECPVCFGKLEVVLVLGNDERVKVPCDYCRVGFDNPRGYVEERYDWQSKVRQVPIEMKEVVEKNGNRNVEYRYEYWVLDNSNVFDTKEEAEDRVKEMVFEQAQEDEKRIAHHKESDYKSYSWHVGYHQRNAKEHKRQMEYHEQKVIAMKKLAEKNKKI